VNLGNYGANRLEELSRSAQVKTEDFGARVQQAAALRSAIENSLAETRSYRTARENLRVVIVSYNSRFNSALQRLMDEFAKTKTIKTQRNDELSAEERKHIDYLLAHETTMIDYLMDVRERVNAEFKSDSTYTPREIATPQDAEIDATLERGTDPATRHSLIESRFLSTQNFLLSAAQAWEKQLGVERQNLLADVATQQAIAAAEMRSRRFWTALLGALIALTTYLVARSQIKQIRKAENEAQEASSLTTSVLNSLRDGVLAINEQGAVFSINPVFEKDFRLTRKECLHQDYRTLLAGLPVLRQIIEQAAQRIASEPNAKRSAERIELKADAETRLFDLEITPRKVGEDERGSVIVLTDVTEIERNREEAERNRALSRIGQLTAQVGHEIYNPLGAIKLNADLLEMQLPGENGDARQTVSRLKRALEHLSTIVLDLRYLSRPREPERQAMELHGLLDEVIELASERLQRAQVTVNRAYAKGTLHGEFDPLQLRKVFLNLLINAIEASPQGSEVTLTTRAVKANALTKGFKAERGALAVSVVDHGSGMSAETKRRVFEAFYSTKQHGTGLGMMITHEIVKKHGGLIEVESEEGKGTTVEVLLPL
ncbi:MAG: PAS domain-containing protein, partial [Acidobacteria bacterium]|nr:PAS domain-containing protein [Acidobacteriota bacterium]